MFDKISRITRYVRALGACASQDNIALCENESDLDNPKVEIHLGQLTYFYYYDSLRLRTCVGMTYPNTDPTKSESVFSIDQHADFPSTSSTIGDRLRVTIGTTPFCWVYYTTNNHPGVTYDLDHIPPDEEQTDWDRMRNNLMRNFDIDAMMNELKRTSYDDNNLANKQVLLVITRLFLAIALSAHESEFINLMKGPEPSSQFFLYGRHPRVGQNSLVHKLDCMISNRIVSLALGSDLFCCKSLPELAELYFSQKNDTIPYHCSV